MELRSGHVAFSAASTPPQGEESQAQTGSATSLGPSTLSTQISASEALRIIDADIDDDTELLAIADTLVSLGAPPTYLPPPLPVQQQQGLSAPSPAWTGQMPDLTLGLETTGWASSWTRAARPRWGWSRREAAQVNHKVDQIELMMLTVVSYSVTTNQ